IGHSSFSLVIPHRHPNLFSLAPTQGQVVAADFDFQGVAERGETDQFDGGPNEQTHLQQAGAVFGRDFDFGDGPKTADGEGGQRAGFGGHTQRFWLGEGSGSTRMVSANWLLMARRALQTRQIKLCWRLSSRIFCSSQRPNSRNRWVI